MEQLGLGNEGGKNLIYVSNFMGKFEVRVKPGTPNSVEREKKGGDKISVINHQTLSGYIVDIQKDVSEKNGIKMVSLKIFLDVPKKEKTDHYCLTLPYNSNLTTAFFHMMENIDYSRPVQFSSKHGKDDKGKEKTSLFISQMNGLSDDWTPLGWRYTKKWVEANPTAPKKPEWKQVEVKGELVWDNTAEIRFFEAILKEQIIKPLREKKVTASAVAAPSAESLVEDDSWIPEQPAADEPKAPDEDLPF
jgi:hypothetical protein